MRIALISFQKYGQKVTLYEDSNARHKYYVMWENREGYSEFPLYMKGYSPEILWDFPEKVSESIKPFVKKCFIARDVLQFAEKYGGWHSYDKRDKVLCDMLFRLQEVKKILVYESGCQFMKV